MLNINWISFLIGTEKFHRTTAVIQPDLCAAATCCSLSSAGFASSSTDHLHSRGLGIKLGYQGMLSSSDSALSFRPSSAEKSLDTGPGCVTCPTEGEPGCISRPHSHRIKRVPCVSPMDCRLLCETRVFLEFHRPRREQRSAEAALKPCISDTTGPREHSGYAELFPRELKYLGCPKFLRMSSWHRVC